MRIGSSDASPKPRRASRAATRCVTPSRDRTRAARAGSGSSAPSASANVARGDSPRLEVGADRQIAKLSTGKRHCPLVREPLVVDDCCRDKRLDDRVAIGLAHPASGEPLAQAGARLIGRPQDADRCIERFLASQRSIQLPGTLSAELDADREPGRRHCVEGQGPPAGPVEIDLDAATSPRAGGCDDRRRHSLAPVLIVAYASTSTSTSTSTSSTAGDASSPERSSPT